MTTPTKQLTTQQLTILKIIYKFRFATPTLIAHYRNITTSTVNESLATLLKDGYIARRYDQSYKLLGKGARYYLTPQSIKLLRQVEGVNEGVLRARYKDKHSTEPFVSSTLEAFKTALEIRSTYPDVFMIFSQYELANYSQFPRPLPSLYLKRLEASKGKPNEYFIEIISDSLFFVVKKLIDKYIEHYEEGEWQGGAYPQLILQTSNASLRRKVAEYIDSLIENGYIGEDELIIQCVLSSHLATEDKLDPLL
jgi:DNA-binding MarR family transcriptional regulator